MYTGLLFFHSLTRWLVLVSLAYSITMAFWGYFADKKFSKLDNSVRHWTATISHIQLILGVILFIKSPIIQYFFKNYEDVRTNEEISFFVEIHSVVMLSAVVLITISSALAKRKNTDKEKFKTILIWFSIALLIILAVIPWPFSPLANRPYLRPL